MQRCLQLAAMGAGKVAPNPVVGAVLVYEDRVIGEGYHHKFGEAHAEVNCINSVAGPDRELISKSTLYVSLEPCAHFGKTPPCANLIIQHNIPEVVIGCADSFEAVAGKGIERLQAAGISVSTGVQEAACRYINRRFFTFHEKKRPYIILKWAQTANGKIGSLNKERLLISNEYTNRRVHQWRSEEGAIMVGTNTALKDDPALTNRLWPGDNPVRIVIDTDLKLPASLKLFDGQARTIVFNKYRHEDAGMLVFYKIEEAANMLREMMEALYNLQIQSVLVEGGAALLNSFITQSLWDEARIVTNTELEIAEAVNAPILQHQTKTGEDRIGSDRIEYFKNDCA